MDPSEDPEEHRLFSYHAAASSVLRYSASQPVLLEGWLAKEGKSLRARKTRYVRLSHHILSSHRSKESPPSWQISIAEAIVDRGQHAREIKICLPHRTLSFTAPTDHLFQSWIVSLRRASVDSTRVDDFYRIGRLVGEGMNGQVRLAQDMLTDDNVAVKMVPRLGRENETEFLAREIQIILSISHPNIVRTIDVFIRSRRIHFVMEYLAGGELFDFIAENTHFTETHAASVMMDLLKALFFLHAKGIAHRDVKLENLLCANKSWPLNVKLADFGFANYVSDGCEPTLSSFVGTPYYIAPEMLRGDPHGRPVDIWASGVVLYILLSGKFPFGGRNESEYYQRVLSKDAYFPDEEWSKISEEAKDLVRGMLCKDPRKRFTAEECLRHSWLKRGDHVREVGEADIFPIDPLADPNLASPDAFRDNRGRRGKRRHLGMLNHSLTKPTDGMIAARNHAEKGRKARLDGSPRSHRSLKDMSRAGTEGSDTSSINRRPSIIRRLLSSGKLSLDRYDGRFPSFRGSVEEAADEATSNPRKTLSLFSRDGPLRRSFHRVGDSRDSRGDDGINFVNSQSQKLPPKIARERQRQQKQAEAARKASRGSGIFSGRKVAEYTQNGYHSSPRLQSHLAHPFHRIPTPHGQSNGAPTRWRRSNHVTQLKREAEVMRLPVPVQLIDTDSPVSSSAEEDTVRRTVSADAALVDRQFCDSEIPKMDLLRERPHVNHGRFHGPFGRRGFRT